MSSGSDGSFVGDYLPGVQKICSLVDKALNIYSPLLENHTKESASVRENAPLHSNRTNLISEVDQAEGMLDPELIDGFHFKIAQQVGERMGVNTKWKFGTGNPMMGMPGVSFEKSFSWMGNKLVVPQEGPPSPNIQFQVGPFDYSGLLNGRVGQTQFVHQTQNTQSVVVGDFDLNTFRVLMLGNKWTPMFGKYHLKSNFMVQIPGGPTQIFAGQSVLQAEVAAHLGKVKGKEFSIGAQSTVPIPAAGTISEYSQALLNVAMMSGLSANPYLVIKGYNPAYQKDKSLICDNFVKLLYDRKDNSITMNVLSKPAMSDPNVIFNTIKSATFLDSISSESKRNSFSPWCNTERSAYKVTSNFNLETKQLKYGLHVCTKWFNKGTNVNLSLESHPGNILPSILKASLHENLMVSAENDPKTCSPLTTEISISYDAADQKPPRIGLGFNFQM